VDIQWRGSMRQDSQRQMRASLLVVPGWLSLIITAQVVPPLLLNGSHLVAVRSQS
jgi:hypothetical protein